MAWIKVEHNLTTKTEVFQMSQMLGISRQEIVGHLVEFWIWADQNTEDGIIIGNRNVVDTLTIPDFANALINVGWLDVIADKLEIPKFLLHNGASAKRRALTAQRVANHRKRNSNTSDVTEPILYNTILNNKEIDKVTEDPNILNVKIFWNKYSKNQIRAITPNRKKAIRKLLKEYTIEQIEMVFEKVAKIPFMQGRNNSNWVADFNYVLKPDKFLKIFEGGWDSQIEKQNDIQGWTQ